MESFSARLVEQRVFGSAVVDGEGGFEPLTGRGGGGVAVVFTSKKDDKVLPFMGGFLDKVRGYCGDGEVLVRRFKVDAVGVREQPLYPEGLEGAWGRVFAFRQLIESDVGFGGDDWMGFRRIFVIGIESDICVMEGVVDVAGYDAPNVCVAELRCGAFLQLRGRGPGCQADVFEFAKRLGLLVGKHEQDVTYGKALAALFGVSDSDWHSVVLASGPVVECRGMGRRDFIDECLRVCWGEVTRFVQEVFVEEVCVGPV